MAKIKNVMVKCKDCARFRFRSIDHGLCDFDQGLLCGDWDRTCSGFKAK
jgi:hypothetical protein